MDITDRFVESNGIRIHISEAGSGPVVILLHGFMNFSFSWRHQLRALSDAGYHAVAPDLRGYALTDAPEPVAEYTVLHLVGDVVGLLDALDAEQAVIVGHDWGAMLAWTLALLRPDRVRGVAGLSVPYVPRGERSLLSAMRAKFGDGYYMQYFQQPRIADDELARDLESTFRSVLFSGSGEAPEPWNPVIAEGEGWLSVLPDPQRLPSWLDDDDLAAYAAAFADSGFTGPLNWYRNFDYNWQLTAAWGDEPIRVPALFVFGEVDSFALYNAALIESLPLRVNDLRGSIGLPGIGHWVQQEAPDQVNEAILSFMATL